MTDRRLAESANTRSNGSTHHRPTVLVVESHDDTRELYAEYLHHVGFNVDAAATTDDALSKVNTADALLTAIAVRGTLDGLGFVRRMRQEHPRTPIIVVTTNTLDSYRQRAIEAGADVFLVKPCLPEDLARELHRMLVSAAAQSASVVSISQHTTMTCDAATNVGSAKHPDNGAVPAVSGGATAVTGPSATRRRPANPSTTVMLTSTSPLSGILRELTAEARYRAQHGGAPLAIIRQLVDAVGVSALAADDAGRYVVTNAAASELTGYADDELRRISVWELTPGTNEREAETLWRAFVQQGEQSGDYQLLTKNGHIVTAEYAARAHVLPNLHVSLLRRR